MQKNRNTKSVVKACIVLPTYNEADNVATIIPAIFEATQSISNHDVIVLVVDDNSPDHTAELINEMKLKYPRLYMISGIKNGLGDAYRRGFEYAINTFQPEYLIQMDADWQHSPDAIEQLVLAAERHYDVVIGSRFINGASTPGFPLQRQVMSRAGHFLFCLFSGINHIKDVTSGFRCIRTSIIRQCRMNEIDTLGYAFQSLLLYQLVKSGASVLEVPIQFRHRNKGTSKLGIKDKMEFLVSMLRLRMK